MLDFRPIELGDKELVEKYYGRENHFLCDYCFTDLFIWGKQYNTEICEYNGFLYTKMNEDNMDYFFAPEGEGDIKPAVDEIFEYTKEKNIPPILILIYPKMRERLESAYPDKFIFEENTGNMDYVYLAEKLINLSGKKLHKKKNHYNRFMKDYEGRWSYEDLDDNNVKEFFSYQLDWCDEDDEFLGELCAASIALKNYKALGIKGGILRIDGKIVAVTLGTQSFPDTFIIQIEKADASINGAYQAINKLFAERNCQNVKYIDREEDMNIEGLRQAKESYYPEFLTMNYVARLK